MGKTADLVLKGTYYYAGLEEYRMGRLKAGSKVFLVHTPDNPHDRNAVAVYLLPTAKPLGHVSKDVAPKYAALADSNQIKSAEVISATKSTKNRLRVEIRLTIDAGEPQAVNSITGTTQRIPSCLEQALLKVRCSLQKERSNMILSAQSRILAAERSVDAAKVAHAAARAQLVRCHVQPDEEAALRQQIDEGKVKHSRAKWGGTGGGALIGGTFGGAVGAFFGGLVGLFLGSGTQYNEKRAAALKKLTAFETSRKQHDRTLRELQKAEEELQRAR